MSVRGGETLVILSIEGRNEDYILTPEGTRITRCDYIFKKTNVVEAQVVQRVLGEMIIRVVLHGGNKNDTEKILKKEIYKCISPTLKVRVEYVDYIKRNRAGKFKAVVSDLNSTKTKT